MPLQTVAIAIHEGVQVLDVAGPIDVFTETNGFVTPGDGYDVRLVAANRGPCRTSSGIRISADFSFAEAEGPFSIALVAGGPALPEAKPDTRMTRWLQTVSQNSGLYGSICTGAFALGHAGLLDGHRVTTHWQNAQRLQSSFP